MQWYHDTCPDGRLASPSSFGVVGVVVVYEYNWLARGNAHSVPVLILTSPKRIVRSIFIWLLSSVLKYPWCEMKTSKREVREVLKKSDPAHQGRYLIGTAAAATEGGSDGDTLLLLSPTGPIFLELDVVGKLILLCRSVKPTIVYSVSILETSKADLETFNSHG